MSVKYRPRTFERKLMSFVTHGFTVVPVSGPSPTVTSLPAVPAIAFDALIYVKREYANLMISKFVISPAVLKAS